MQRQPYHGAPSWQWISDGRHETRAKAEAPPLSIRPRCGFLCGMPPPKEYVRDYEQLRRRMDRVFPRPDAAVDTALARATCGEIEQFARRWEKRFPQPEFHVVLHGLRDWAEQMRRHLEEVRGRHLLELLAARNECAITRMMFDFGCAFTKTLQKTPPDQRPALEAIYEEEMGQPYNAETEFRETEALLDQSEARFKKGWETFQAAFPEHATETLRQRLLNAGPEELKTWQAELTAQPASPALQ